MDLSNDLDAFVWAVAFSDTGDRIAASAAVDRFHREPSYYLALVDLMMERKRLCPAVSLLG